MFQNLTTEGHEEVQDRLGGFRPLESDIHPGTIKALYAGQATSGAKSVTLIADVGGQEYRETFYVTNKEGQNFFINKNSGKKSSLPGFSTVNDICLIACEKELHQMAFEEKVINLYNWDEKKQVPTKVMMATEAIGKKLALGILKILENKKEKMGDEYQEIADSREVNAVDKVFHPELKVTVYEARNGKDATFWDAWLERNKGQTQDRRKIKDGEVGAKGGSSKPPSAPPAAQQTERRSLFAKK